MKKIWKIIGILATIGGCIGFLLYFIPKKNWSKINNEYLSKFESYNVPDKNVFDLFYNISIENEDKINSKTWNKYASSILSIYDQSNPNSEIKINDTIVGRITSRERRVDLTINTKVAGQDILIACKLYPWKSSITKAELYSFNYLLKDINASKGVIILNHDIDSSMIDFANQNLISLCNLKDTDTKRWDEEIKIPVYWIQIIPKFHFSPTFKLEAGDKMHKDFSKAQFSYDNDNQVFTIIDYLNYKWEHNEMPHNTDSLHIFYLNTKGLKIKVNNDDWRDVSKFEVYYTTDKNYWLRYFEPHNYKAIENHITHDIVFSELEVNVEKFKIENERDWIKIEQKNIEINELKGLNLFVTVNYDKLTREDMVIDGLRFEKVE